MSMLCNRLSIVASVLLASASLVGCGTRAGTAPISPVSVEAMARPSNPDGACEPDEDYPNDKTVCRIKVIVTDCQHIQVKPLYVGVPKDGNGKLMRWKIRNKNDTATDNNFQFHPTGGVVVYNDLGGRFTFRSSGDEQKFSLHNKTKRGAAGDPAEEYEYGIVLAQSNGSTCKVDPFIRNHN